MWPLAARFYRALLRLYPASFRAEYGDELYAVYSERASRAGGPLALPRMVVAALADVVPNAAAVHRDMLRQDLRYAARSLRRSPGFAATAILVTALGVGANTAAFSLADFVLLRPLPFPQPDRLVKLWQTTPEYGRVEFSPANYRDLRAATGSFGGTGAYFDWATNLVGSGEPRRLETVLVTPGLLPLLGVPAHIGRVIGPADSASDPVAVLSYALWQSQFGGDDGILGRTVRLDGTPHVVVGVMPPSFHFPSRDAQAWTPLVLREDDFLDRNNNYLEVVARLRPGVSLERAREEVSVAMARLERQHPEENRRTSASVNRLRDELSERSRLLVLALCGAALCILLLASANLAGLLLARARQRARELAVRAALGAARGRLVRQLVTESAALAVVGGAVGVAVAVAGMPLLARLVPSTLPTAAQPSVDVHVLVIAAAFVAATGLAFGIAPAVRVGRDGAFEALRDDGRAGGGRTRRLRAGLVVVEVAASVVLLVSSGLLIRAVWNIRATDPGFRAEEVLTLRTALPLPKYEATAARARFYEQVLRDVRALPGVQEAAYATGLPLTMTGGIWPVAVPSETPLEAGSNSVSLRFVTPRFFATLGIPLLRGRDVAETDGGEDPFVAVVSRSFARRHWPGEDPIGKRFTVAFSERTVVGVVGDVRVRGLERPSEPQVYLPYRQVPDGSLIGYTPKDLVVRSASPAATLLPAIRRAIGAADPDQPVSHVRAMEEIVAEETAPRMTQLRLLATLSAIALLIAGVGIHGLLMFSVAQRSRELAVRLALGAGAGRVVGMVLREGMLLTLAGIALGAGLAYPAARAMGALLAGVPPEDPATMAAAAGLCLLTAMAGCLRPAVQVARVDPMAALRAE